MSTKANTETPNFNELKFGQLDATQEAQSDPVLLTDGYFDYRDAAYRIAMGNAWLLLGPKGSGKSAVLEHLGLRWTDMPEKFFTIWDLAGFPVSDVATALDADRLGSARNQAAWERLLIFKLVESLRLDQGAELPPALEVIAGELEAIGVIGASATDTRSRWRVDRLRFDVKVLAAEVAIAGEAPSLVDIAGRLRELLRQVRTQSQHVLAVDGLDSFFFEVADEWASLTGLLQASQSLNVWLAAGGSRVSIVIAARSDVFDMVPSANTNKMKQNAVFLDWQARGIGSQNHLWELLSAKVAASHPQITNVQSKYLSTSVNIGPHRDLSEYLLDNTRLLPRDLIALMGHLQQCYRGRNLVTEDAAKRAVQRYAEQYFVGEIFDNVAGVLPASRARGVVAFKDALRTAPTRKFDFEYVCAEVEDELTREEVKHLLRQMFETGGIGVVNRGLTEFAFRKVSGAGFTVRGEFLLHDALTRAWSRPWR